MYYKKFINATKEALKKKDEEKLDQIIRTTEDIERFLLGRKLTLIELTTILDLGRYNFFRCSGSLGALLEERKNKKGTKEFLKKELQKSPNPNKGSKEILMQAMNFGLLTTEEISKFIEKYQKEEFFLSSCISVLERYLKRYPEKKSITLEKILEDLRRESYKSDENWVPGH